MSLRIDASEWISGCLLIGETGLGVLAENIPSTGTSGASYLYNDLSLPADNGKEICGQITSWPSAGTLFAYEDGSFSFTGAPDGAYSFDYTLYLDGVDSGSTTVTLTVGSGVITHATTGALATIGAEAAGTAARFRAMATSGALATAGAEITGSATRFRAMATSGVLTNAGATITGSANRYREMGTSGALAPTGAVVIGTSVRYRTTDTSGALATAGAEITGSAARFRAFGTSGTLATAGAEINGTAVRSTPGVGVYPDPSQVLSGVMYGPTGTEYTGTLSIVLDLNTGRLFKILTTKVGLLL